MDLDQAAALARSLPGAEEGERRGALAWSVNGKVFAWERPYTKADIKRFGVEPYPQEPLVAVRTAGLVEKEALLASSSPAVFTMEHFDGFAAVLVELGQVEAEELREVVVDGWSVYASPAQLAEQDTAPGSQ
ncbi:hypothetical protein RB608_23370 [Nocardioides sp. LHD-245]|uniref:MmcQ/YjbR family DNA-binding protein n=1 Tax=Nocardioides sp. LHD-245 TaxID=3051387 RepID=UPI0027DFF7D6|nr:hypothetical protein [Nocardioides sp. LHD-245]